MSVPHEKMLAKIELRCESDFKDRITQAANGLDIDFSVFVRDALHEKLDRLVAQYEQLHRAVGSARDSAPFSVTTETK